MGKSEIAEIAEIATSRDINLKKRYFWKKKDLRVLRGNLFLGIEIFTTVSFCKTPQDPAQCKLEDHDTIKRN